jgi:hypothetical protein
VESVTASLLFLMEEEAKTDQIGPGLVAFTIVALLAVATFFLIKSMLHHMGKVPPTFDADDRDAVTDRERGDSSSDSDVG